MATDTGVTEPPKKTSDEGLVHTDSPCPHCGEGHVVHYRADNGRRMRFCSVTCGWSSHGGAPFVYIREG